MEKIKVKKAKLYEEGGKYYVDVTYIAENDRVIKEVHFPKMPFALELWDGNIETNYFFDQFDFHRSGPARNIRLGELSVPLRYANGVDFVERIIEEKTQEMTIDEIEKKLGYKIKIVNKK